MADEYGQAGYEAEQAARLAPLVDGVLGWLRDGPPGLRVDAVVDARFPTGGASSDLLLLDVDCGGAARGLAVRLQPRHAVYPDVDLGRQFRCLDAAHRHGPAPVPAPLWHEPDPSILGVPFLVSERVGGAPGDHRFEAQAAASAPEAQAEVWRTGVALLAAVHATDVRAARLDDRLGSGTTPVDRYLDHWRHYRAFVEDGREQPVLDAALERLEDTRPTAAGEETLVWGDARFGNVLYHDGAPAAVLDFEFAHVGLPGFDVAFFVHFDRVSFEYFRPGRRLPGFGSPDDTFDLYESLTGRRIVERDWYLLLAATYSALAVTRVMQPRAAAGLVPEELVVAHPSMRALADLLDLPVPERAR